MKKLLFIMTLFIASFAQAQGTVTTQVTQDVRFGVIGDESRGYPACTVDVVVSVQLQGNQQRFGYMVVYPEFEYADLKFEPYKRYSANVGYTLNRLFVKNLEVGAAVGYGITERAGAHFTWSLNGYTKYKLNETLKLVGNLQYVQRNEFDDLYGTANEWKMSAFLGVEISIFKAWGGRK